MTVFERLTLSVRLLLIALLSLPVLAGLIGVLLPAFGYFPALDAHSFTLNEHQGQGKIGRAHV